ncbi:thioredoxin family protein [Edaphobacillus lindanitolerans]|uniref:Thiol-disulfide isomerase or thioredoxin n=1 Tax=Edaphobacillus lindanitolerans TaxID=550447 RepID=A0A1U7PRL8_9BACI|nr:thioredoxin family protein [Edaphobacillus lindanitolerans]SIT92939.1 Thiol-disulfide isomerase or thioredoxin [Edaphobacillus lindanitolerans]
MKTEQQYFEEGIPLGTYMEGMTTHKENSQKVYEGFKMPQGDEFIGLLQEKKPHILVITEDWCGDAMMNNPILRHIAETAGIDARVAYRDADTELIDRWLTNGGRSIPVYLLMDDAGEVLAKWGPRAPQLQEFVMEQKNSLPPKEDPSFEEKQKSMYASMMEQNTSNGDFWLWVYEDIRKTFMAALQKQD